MCFSCCLYIDRPVTFRGKIMEAERGISFAGDNPSWQFKKKQMTISLKQHGDGLKHLEDLALKHGNELMTKLEEHGTGKAFDPYTLIYKMVGSIMMTLVFGEHNKTEADLVYRHYTDTKKVFQANGPYVLLDIFPALRFFLPIARKAYHVFLTCTDEMKQTYISLTETRRRQMQKNEAVRPCIDHFIKLSDQKLSFQKANKSQKVIEPRDVAVIGCEILIAGISTTAATIYSTLAILVNHPDIQDRAYRQIIDTIGNRAPTMADRQNMPFVEALILEVFRYISVSPLLVPHCATRDTVLKGYAIPRGTLVMCNIWNLHHDERYWKDPWVFDPERFIQNGSVIPPDHEMRQNLIIFSAGRRHCPGAVFAKNRLFLLITMMLQKFRFLPAEGEPAPIHDPRSYNTKLVLETKPYKLSVELRD